MSSTIPQDEIVIACDPTTLTREQQQWWVDEVLPKLYGAVTEIQELPNGWGLRLPSESSLLVLAAEDINLERLCCPFIHFSLEIPPNHGDFWFRMTGNADVKAFVRMMLETAGGFDENILRAAGLQVTPQPKIDSVETAMEVVEQINERYASQAGS